MKNYLTFGGVPTTDFNMWISGGGTYDAPERDTTAQTIAGRNGDLFLDNGRFNNIDVEYPAFIPREFESNIARFRAQFKRLIGYQRLEDTYHPDYYRMAVLPSNFAVSTTTRNLAGTLSLTFNCKPQRFLKSGENSITFEEDGTLLNPTLFESKPLIRAYGTGDFSINGTPVTISSADTYTDIDSEIMDAYKVVNGIVVNKNPYVYIPKYPTLINGENVIDLGTITKLEIIPRWWTI